MTSHVPKRHPLRTKAVLAAVLVEVVLVLGALGVAPEHVGLVEVVGGSVLTVLTLAGLVRSGEREVTPSSDPRGPDGEELVPASHVDLVVGVNGYLRSMLERHGIELEDPPPPRRRDGHGVGGGNVDGPAQPGG